LAAAALLAPLGGSAPPRQDAPLDLGEVTERQVMVPMRDGVRLSVYLYFPKGEGPWPVLLEQRYANARDAGSRTSFARLAARGYVVALQSFRGSQQSEGKWVGYRALGWGAEQDGYDTVEWLARQPWSDGKVGSFGSSQAGFAQNFLAVTQPPHLVCQYMIDTGLSLFHEGYRIGGTTRPRRFKGMSVVCRVPADNDDLLAEWDRHPTYDAYWAEEDCTRFIAKMNVPCFTVGSWYDFMNVGSITSYVGRQGRGGPNARGRQQLILGPWLHGRFNKGTRVAGLVYPPNAEFDMMAHMVRWFDFHLKGEPSGVDRDPRVRYYVMGALGEAGAPGNEWRSASDWPVTAVPTSYYLREGAALSRERPRAAAGETKFKADPFRPNAIPQTTFPGGADARGFEGQPEVRTFTTEVLGEPVEWTGKVTAELYVDSTARDTDFIVRLSDVYPGGESILIVDSIRRARFREGYARETFMTPGRVYRVAFDVGWLSQIFNRGHRIRVTVASTGAPFYEVNPNTGGPMPFSTDRLPADAVVAVNGVRHDRVHASRIVAPQRALDRR
jgi:predicted acyl esterase